MSYYPNDSWSAGGRQPSWDQQAAPQQQQQQNQQQQSQQQQQQPPSRSGASSASAREEPNAFAYQLTEVDRAIDNLVKSGKFPMMGFPGGPRRGENMPMMPGRGGFPEFDPRMGQAPRHPGAGGDFEGGMRPQPGANLQNFYANQRYGSRPEQNNEAAQARRRVAAQRERELRNYHQEQQYHKQLSGAKSDRSMSPSTSTSMSEDDRRDLIARQHRALYGEKSNMYNNDPNTSRPTSQDARVSSATGLRGSSPLAFDPFGNGGQKSGEPAVQMSSRDGAQNKDSGAPGTQRSRANSPSSPSSNPTTSFSLFEKGQQSSRTSNSSPGGSPPRQGAKATPTGGVAPIGTRPNQNQAQGSNNMQKRATTPLPSPLSYGYTASDSNNNNERSTSVSSNPPSDNKGVGLGWGSNSGVWGNSKGSLGVQASVWG